MSATPFELHSRRLGKPDCQVVVIDTTQSGTGRLLKVFRGSSAASRARVYLDALQVGWFAGRKHEQREQQQQREPVAA